MSNQERKPTEQLANSGWRNATRDWKNKSKNPQLQNERYSKPTPTRNIQDTVDRKWNTPHSNQSISSEQSWRNPAAGGGAGGGGAWGNSVPAAPTTTTTTATDTWGAPKTNAPTNANSSWGSSVPAAPTTTTTTATDTWGVPKTDTHPKQTAPPSTATDGWTTVAAGGAGGGGKEWGEMTLTDMWPKTNVDHEATARERLEKQRIEDGRGVWENGSHLPAPRNQELELQLFGTCDTKEVTHTGINFEKYADIPVQVQGNDLPECMNEFVTPPVDQHLLENIRLARYTTPTPVQKYSLPIVMAGRDLMACAQTGSGKTGGFLFPILSAMFTKGPREPSKGSLDSATRRVCPGALILSPTRELTSQIYDEAKKFAYRSYVRPCVVYGGTDINAQIRQLSRGCDVLVATPGRLVDLIERKRISLSRIRYLVLDEADRMLDMGFEPQIRRIVDGEDMPDVLHRQTLLFSATFPENIQVLARDFLKEYVFLSVGRVGATTENITQKIMLVENDHKRNHLLQVLVEQGKVGLTLIFTETKRTASALYEFLISREYPATAIHGDCLQSEREAALKDFKSGRCPIMVATSVAARGLDIPNVMHVISFDLPNGIDDYVHRIGRTGRAGNTGLATTFFTRNNRHLGPKMIKLLSEANQEVPSWLETMQPDPDHDSFGSRSRGRGGFSRRKDFDDIGPRIKNPTYR